MEKNYMMEEFIDEYLNENEQLVEEDHIEEVAEKCDVEAMPFVLNEEDFSDGITDRGLSVEDVKKVIEDRLTEYGSYIALKYDNASNKLVVQDLKSSMVSLKFSTSRIEKEVRDLTAIINQFSSEKKLLEGSLLDLEFRFNELVTNQEALDDNNNPEECKSNDGSIEKQYDRYVVKNVIEDLEGKIQQLDDRIATIDNQNHRINTLASDIKQNKHVVKDLKRLIECNESHMKKSTETILSDVPSPSEPPPHGNRKLEEKLEAFIEKTHLNTKHIETAWVGLIAALLLIPIAFFFGKLS